MGILQTHSTIFHDAFENDYKMTPDVGHVKRIFRQNQLKVNAMKAYTDITSVILLV